MGVILYFCVECFRVRHREGVESQDTEQSFYNQSSLLSRFLTSNRSGKAISNPSAKVARNKSPFSKFPSFGWPGGGSKLFQKGSYKNRTQFKTPPSTTNMNTLSKCVLKKPNWFDGSEASPLLKTDQKSMLIKHQSTTKFADERSHSTKAEFMKTKFAKLPASTAPGSSSSSSIVNLANFPFGGNLIKSIASTVNHARAMLLMRHWIASPAKGKELNTKRTAKFVATSSKMSSNRGKISSPPVSTTITSTNTKMATTTETTTASEQETTPKSP